MSERYGSRFTDGGYQAPRTHAAALQRGQAVRSLEWRIGTARVTLKLVPMLNGRPELFELELLSDDPAAKQTVYTPCMIRGETFARQAFALTAGELDAGRIPDAVLTAPGTPLGP